MSNSRQQQHAYMDLQQVNPLLYWTDSYKVSHIRFETYGIDEIYSNFTPRFSKYISTMLGDAFDGNYVAFGAQYALKRLHEFMEIGFFSREKEEAIQEMKDVMGPYIGQENYAHFEALHDLGYLPIIVKTLDEGTIAPVGVPFLTIRNTLPAFQWLPNYIEPCLSAEIWKELTVATIGRAFRSITNKYALETSGSLVGTEFQNHDFSYRGQAGFESSSIVGCAFLLSSCGTDNIPALWSAKKYYNSKNGDQLLACSVPAGEHSVTTSGILTEQERWNEWSNQNKISLSEAETLYASMLLTERFPTGIFSYVADSYDYWNFIEIILPNLKDLIMKRDGKFVVRGDSGNPVDVICGSFKSEYEFESLEDAKDDIRDIAWEYFTENCDSDGYIDETQYNVLIGGIPHRIDVKASVERERGGYSDNNYYVVDSVEVINVNRIEMNAESKGTIESLWEIFGGTINEQGYKVLDSHIGMIYGDGITVQRSEEILARLKAKGFASCNIVFGVGSYSLNMVSRDHLGMTIKATNTIVDINGKLVDKPVYKDPKTDSSKKSARGLIQVEKIDGVLTLIDNVNRENEQKGYLTTAYKEGNFLKDFTIFEIREKMWN